MLLNEVALGNEWSTKSGDGHLVAAPSGHDSIVARGTQEPGTNIIVLSECKYNY